MQGVRLHAIPRPKDACLSVRVAYDAIAAGYDDQVRGDEIVSGHGRSHVGGRDAVNRLVSDE